MGSQGWEPLPERPQPLSVSWNLDTWHLQLCLISSVSPFCFVPFGLQDHFLFDKPVSPLLTCAGMARDWPDARGIWYGHSISHLQCVQRISCRSSACPNPKLLWRALDSMPRLSQMERVFRNCVCVCVLKYCDVSKMCRNVCWLAWIMHEKKTIFFFKKKLASCYLTSQRMFH